jgi:hypothetical protein
MRLLGGIAVFHLAPSARTSALARTYHDYDVVVPSRQGSPVARIFREAGYAADAHFNALHGARRMIFTAPGGFVVDVLVGTFQMCHQLELGRELPSGGLTIHPADLLLTKLQIVQIEDKDLRDAVALLADLPTQGQPADRPAQGRPADRPAQGQPADRPAQGQSADRPAQGPPAAIDVDRFVAPLAGDWGFYHTVERNLPRVVAFARERLGEAGAQPVVESAGRLLGAMRAAPKSVRWKVRARVGEKVAWYELPEEPG